MEGQVADIGVVDISIGSLLLAYVFWLLLLALFYKTKINKERELVIGTVRMTIQLILMGFVLGYILDNQNWIITILVLCLMLSFAIYNVFGRTKLPLSKAMKKVIAISIVTGTCFSIFYFLFVILALQPWYDARYVIPIAGMIIGNSMSGISLGVERLLHGMTNKREQIEGTLALGASPATASLEVVQDAYNAAILPTINSMMGMGIVFLPGLMTGQILAGISPNTAIAYQIAIMLAIIGSVGLSVFILVQMGYRTFFNKRAQLI